MSGLPGSGKSTVAGRIAADLGCAVISVDTIERGLHDAGVDSAQPIGHARSVSAERLKGSGEQLLLGVVLAEGGDGLEAQCAARREGAQRAV